MIMHVSFTSSGKAGEMRHDIESRLKLPGIELLEPGKPDQNYVPDMTDFGNAQ